MSRLSNVASSLPESILGANLQLLRFSISEQLNSISHTGCYKMLLNIPAPTIQYTLDNTLGSIT